MSRISAVMTAVWLSVALLWTCTTPSRDAGVRGAALFERQEALFLSALEAVFAQYREFRKPDAQITELHVYDFDHTIADTRTTIPVRPPNGPLRYSDSKCIDIRKGDRPDFEVFTEAELDRAAPIPPTIERLRALRGRRDVFVFVVTARGQEHTFRSALRYLSRHGAAVHGVLPIHSELLEQRLWTPLKAEAIPSAWKKALLIAALAQQARKVGANIRLVRYHEDTDSYVRGYFEVLPELVPESRLEAYDYIRTPRGPNFEYREALIGYVERQQVRLPDGRPFASFREYNSGDCPR